jgi:hypothetical protein
MIFATGEIKEGFFDNGIFKFDGNEAKIKQFMKVNNIRSSGGIPDESTSSSNILKNSNDSKNSKKNLN